MFNVDKFNNETLTHRTKEVTVTRLAEYFSEGDDPTIKVRALSGAEYARATWAQAVQQAVLDGESEAAGDSQSKHLTKTFFERLYGSSQEQPASFVYHMEIVVLGTALQRQTVVRIAKHFPAEFNLLRDTILELSALGSLSKKKLQESTLKKKL